MKRISSLKKPTRKPSPALWVLITRPSLSAAGQQNGNDLAVYIYRVFIAPTYVIQTNVGAGFYSSSQ
jgi:hypothetical protein